MRFPVATLLPTVMVFSMGYIFFILCDFSSNSSANSTGHPSTDSEEYDLHFAPYNGTELEEMVDPGSILLDSETEVETEPLSLIENAPLTENAVAASAPGLKMENEMAPMKAVHEALSISVSSRREHGDGSLSKVDHDESPRSKSTLDHLDMGGAAKESREHGANSTRQERMEVMVKNESEPEKEVGAVAGELEPLPNNAWGGLDKAPNDFLSREKTHNDGKEVSKTPDSEDEDDEEKYDEDESAEDSSHNPHIKGLSLEATKTRMEKQKLERSNRFQHYQDQKRLQKQRLALLEERKQLDEGGVDPEDEDKGSDIEEEQQGDAVHSNALHRENAEEKEENKRIHHEGGIEPMDETVPPGDQTRPLGWSGTIAEPTSLREGPAPPRLFFLFMVIDSMPLAPYWDLFFRNVPTDRYVLIAHCAKRCTLPSNVKRISRERTTWCLSLVGAMNALLREAIRTKGTHENDHFVFLSETTLPSKSFDTVYRTFIKENGRSNICISPGASWVSVMVTHKMNADLFESNVRHWIPESNSWARFKIHNDEAKYLFVKHSQWVSLNRKHAKKSVRQWIRFRTANRGGRRIMKPVRLWAKDTCLEEHWFFMSLFGLVPDAFEGSIPLPEISHVQNSANDFLQVNKNSTTAQGKCFTMVIWQEPKSGLPKFLQEDEGTDLHIGNIFHPAMLYKLSAKSLKAMVDSDYSFVRKVNSGITTDESCDLLSMFNHLVLGGEPTPCTAHLA